MSRWTIPEMQELAARGLGKVTVHGSRGATLVSLEEIEAMAGLLFLCGLTPTEPGSYPAPNKIPHSEGERA